MQNWKATGGSTVGGSLRPRELTFAGIARSANRRGFGELICLIESSFHDEMGRERIDLYIESRLDPYSEGNFLQMDDALLLDWFSAELCRQNYSRRL